jgi:hypothetical protein
MDYFEQIEAYIDNSLSSSERLVFEEAMSRDEKLKQAVEDHSIAMDVVGSILEDEVRKVIEDELLINNEQLIIDNVGEETESGKLKVENGGKDEGEKEGESEKSGGVVLPIGGESKEGKGAVKRMNWMRWASAAAVVFVLGWWGMDMLTGVDDSQLYSEIYSDPSWPAERGDDETDLSKSIIKYLTGNKDVAKLELQKLSSTESNYWLAEIYFKEMKFDSTLLFLPIELGAENNKRDRINYLKILSLYFDGDKIESKEAFDKLPQDTDSYYQKLYSKLSF